MPKPYKLLRINPDSDLCQPCQKLVMSILTYPLASEDWDLEAHRSIFKHHYTSLRLLYESANTCRACKIFKNGFITVLDPQNQDLRHEIAKWGSNCGLELFLSRPESEIEDTETDDSANSDSTDSDSTDIDWTERDDLIYYRSVPIKIYRKHGVASDWSSANISDLFGPDTWPPLLPRVNPDMSSEEVFQRIRSWLSECLEQHTLCKRSPSKLPKRILDVGTSPSSLIELIESSGIDGCYVTLSYSWGTGAPLKTMSSNIDKHRSGLSLEAFPKTLADAISYTRRLGFRYLWIDALCIIQDDLDDWAEQAANMTSIYKGSTITISASSATDCHSGLFFLKPEVETSIGQYLHPTDDENYGTIFLGPQSWRDRYFLSSRGWTLQENLVSPATLHFTNCGVAWECAYKAELEANEGGYPPPNIAHKRAWHDLTKLNLALHGSSKLIQNNLQHLKSKFYPIWNEWVIQFTKRDLTKIDDKLPAMAGIAKFFASQLNDRYLAGLWEKNFVPGLMWMRGYRAGSLVKHYEAGSPSWSWASVTGNLMYMDWQIKPPKPRLDMVIHNVDLIEKRPGTFGHASGMIVAEGLLQEVKIGQLRETDSHGDWIDGILPEIPVCCVIQCKMDRCLEPDEILSCWCLRLGVYPVGGIDTDDEDTGSEDLDGKDTRKKDEDAVAVLLLERISTNPSCFRRIGVGHTRTSEWIGHPDDLDQVLNSGQWESFQII